MGLVPKNLGPDDQKTLQRLEQEIIQTLRKAHNKIKLGQCKRESERWFGDNTSDWMRSLGTKVDNLASMLNVKEITVDGLDFRHRNPNFYAWAYPPKDDWQEFTSMTHAQDQNFRISLDSNWETLPVYRPGTIPGYSKFHGIVHELTHLILGTNDEPNPYGVDNCKRKARHNSTSAKNNADNWAFFVDDIRPLSATEKAPSVVIKAVSFDDWHKKSKLSAIYRRNRALQKVDSNFKDFGSRPSLQNRKALATAFKKWYDDNPKDRVRCNKDQIVKRTHNWLDSLS